MTQSVPKGVRRLKGYLLREVIQSEHTLTNTLGSLALLMLTPLNTYGKGLATGEKIRDMLGKHRINHIIKKYRVKFTYPP